MMEPESPALINYLDDGELNVFKWITDSEKHTELKRTLDAESKQNGKKLKTFQPRTTYPKKDPRQSDWYLDYVIDEGRTFRNPDHRDGKLFQSRFFLSFDDVQELVAEIKNPRNYFWKEKKDAYGKLAHPIELLVLGSLRILTRNVTLDCLYEATRISSSVHKAFFTRFVHWYAHTVFPEKVRMPGTSQEELISNSAEYITAGIPCLEQSCLAWRFQEGPLQPDSHHQR
jgi:hypothetical protein